MKQNRKIVKEKISQALCQEIKGLPRYVQEILIDDLVTAFENRLVVYTRKQPSFIFEMIPLVEVSQ